MMPVEASALIGALGWRGALLVYAALSLATLALHRRIPDDVAPPGAHTPRPAPGRRSERHHLACAWLFAWVVTCAGLLNIWDVMLNAAMSSHMIGLMAALGLGAALAIPLAALRGVGQTAARLVEVLFGHHWHPATLNLVATAVLPLAFAATLPAPLGIAGGLAFAVLYGAGNGLVTITRGSLPLVLFDTRVYGQLVGRLLAPGFLVAAAAPMAFAWCEAALGARATAFLAMLLAASMTMASAALWRLSRNHA